MNITEVSTKFEFIHVELMKLKKLYRDETNRKAKFYKAKIRLLLMQLEALKRNYNSIVINMALLKKEFETQWMKLRDKAKRRIFKYKPLVNNLRKENAKLRRDLISSKAYAGPLQKLQEKYEGIRKKLNLDGKHAKVDKEASKEKLEDATAKVSQFEKELEEKGYLESLWIEKVNKWKDDFAELIQDKAKAEQKWNNVKNDITGGFNEDQKKNEEKIVMLNQTIEELGNLIINRSDT